MAVVTRGFASLEARQLAVESEGGPAKLERNNTLVGSQAVRYGYLSLDGSAATVPISGDPPETWGPEQHVKGRRGWWGTAAIDVANTAAKSRDFVPVFKFNKFWIEDGQVTEGSSTLTSPAEGNFFATTLVGVSVVGPGIPAGATVASVQSTTSLTLSANATATGSGLRVLFDRAGVTDLFYVRHGGAGPSTFGVGVSPGSGLARMEVAGSDLAPALQTLRVIVAGTQTGKALSIVDSGGVDRLWVEGAAGYPVLNGNHGTYASGVVMYRLILAPTAVNNVPLVIKAPSGHGTDIGLVQLNGISKMGWDSTGRLKVYESAFFQTTVGVAGAAAALPLTPTKYLQVQDNAGVRYVIPCYIAS